MPTWREETSGQKGETTVAIDDGRQDEEEIGIPREANGAPQTEEALNHRRKRHDGDGQDEADPEATLEVPHHPLVVITVVSRMILSGWPLCGRLGAVCMGIHPMDLLNA